MKRRPPTWPGRWSDRAPSEQERAASRLLEAARSSESLSPLARTRIVAALEGARRTRTILFWPLAGCLALGALAVVMWSRSPRAPAPQAALARVVEEHAARAPVAASFGAMHLVDRLRLVRGDRSRQAHLTYVETWRRPPRFALSSWAEAYEPIHGELQAREAPRPTARDHRAGLEAGAAPRSHAPPVLGASELALEAKLLAEVVAALHEPEGAAVALRRLDEHDATYARGSLAPEAFSLRVRALLALGRTAEALVQLDGALAISAEMRALRGELRAEAARCDEAIADFDHVLAIAHETRAAERALYGRAACRSKQHDDDRARADLEAYVSRFPRGAFREKAERALDHRP